jgi:hypothetical protein
MGNESEKVRCVFSVRLEESTVYEHRNAKKETPDIRSKRIVKVSNVGAGVTSVRTRRNGRCAATCVKSVGRSLSPHESSISNTFTHSKRSAAANNDIEISPYVIERGARTF